MQKVQLQPEELPFQVAYRQNIKDHPHLREPRPGDLHVESGIGRFYSGKHVIDIYLGTVIRVKNGVDYTFEPSTVVVRKRSLD